MKFKYVTFDEILARRLKDDEFRLLYEEHKFYLQIARLVSSLRIKANLTQGELAKKAKISQPMLARLEKGDLSRTPTFNTIAKILNALDYVISFNVEKAKKRRVA